MSTSSPGRRRTASTRRRLYALITAAFTILQPLLTDAPTAAAQSRRRAIAPRPARMDARASPPSGVRAPKPLFANPATTVFINEIHYDDAGADANEFVEVAAPAGTNMANYSVVLYNGNGGASYHADALSGTAANQSGGYGFASINYPSDGVQNGAPDGIALVNTATNTLVQFLCYEGTFTAVGGVANGVTCTDIGVSENASAEGASLQLQGNGTAYGDFTWAATNALNANTKGSVNTAQTFTGAGPTPTPSPSPAPTLAVNDVSRDEGNAGTTAFTFTVSISAASAASVTFNWSTADGTANAGGDYAAAAGSGTIAAGNTSTTITVNVSGDTNAEPDETFFVNISGVTGATVHDSQGQGTIVNDDVTLTPIYAIQGRGTTSPLAGQPVNTTGVVTGLKGNGFFIQDASGDGDAATSDAVFVFTSGAPPAAAAVGNLVRVSGTVQEFVPTGDARQKPLTEISGSPATSVIAAGQALPAPAAVTAADTLVNDLENLERFEGMRVQFGSLTVVAPSGGSIDEPNAAVTTDGVFYAVVTGVARPFREPGIDASDPLPAGAPARIPRFDENPERLRVDSDAQPGTAAAQVSAGAVLSNVVGELDYASRTWTILPESTIAGDDGGATPAPAPAPNEFTVASFNMERFFDTADAAGVNEPVLTSAAFGRRLAKASHAVRDVQRYPDVIGVQEVENLTTLQAVAARINSDAQALDGLPDPRYTAYLEEGNDPGGIDVGFLVKSSRVSVLGVTQVEKDATYTNPNTGAEETLNDRPPLVLRASAARPEGGSVTFTVIVNHLRSLSGIDDETPSGTGTEGARVRAKRRAQAEFLAGYIQSRQSADPAEKIITVGDMNAFRFNDGYVDVVGTILGTPAPADQVVLASSDLVNPDQTDLLDTLPAGQRYSFAFDGNAQALDHVFVNPNALAILDRFAYARDAADQPLADYAEPGDPDRVSDHDQPVAYFSLDVPQPQGSLVISEFRLRGPAGAGDEFVEFYNNTDSDITVTTTDGSDGWALVAADGQTRFIIPSGSTIGARRHFLAAGTGYSLCPDPDADCYAEPDQVLLPGGATPAGRYAPDIPDGSGIALFRTSNPANFTAAERLDAVGYAPAPALFREGAGLPMGGAEIGGDLQHSWLRQECAFVGGVGCTTPGTPRDTGDNAADFISVDTSGALQSLGAPGPESSLSAHTRNSSFGFALLDAGRPSSQAPNRDRDFNSNPNDNRTFGTMVIRRTLTNNTGTPVSYLAFRVIQVTTWPQTPSQADLRALDSPDVKVTLSSGAEVPVRGTFLEQPPDQPIGGGLNSSLAVGYISLEGNPLQDGDSVNVQFVLGVQKTGTFRFYINIEALDTPDSSAPSSMQELKRRRLDLRPNGGRKLRPRAAR